MIDINKGVITEKQWSEGKKPWCYNRDRPDPRATPVYHSKGNVSWPYVFTVGCGNARFPAPQCKGCKHVIADQEKQKKKAAEFKKNKLKYKAARK